MQFSRSLLLIFFVGYTYSLFGQSENDSTVNSLSSDLDSVSRVKSDSIIQENDSINISKKGNYEAYASKDIETTIKYKAKDSIRFDVKSQILKLNNESQIDYGNLQMKAYEIDISWQNNEVISKGKTDDSTGKYVGTPVFKQGSDTYVAKQIKYNYQTEKGLITDIVTQQGEGYIHGQTVKKNNDTDFFLDNARYTTCNLAHPHFEINARRIKMIKDKKIVTGPFNLQIENVPTPIGFAFGMFPTTNNQRASGVIIPTYGEAQDRGFFLRDGGYYFGFSDYFDAKIMGEIYSRGGFGLNNVVNYKKRYHFDGNLNFRYVRRPQPGTDIDDRNFIRDIWFSWGQVPVARGNSRFSANVALGSTRFNERNAFQANNFLSNTFNSAISYSTSFPGTPFNMVLSATQNQNTQTGIMNVSLPNFSFNMNQIQPFKKKVSAGQAWYEKIRVSYQSVAANSITNAPIGGGGFPFRVSNLTQRETEPLSINLDTLPILLERARFGMQHTVPVAASFRVLKHFSINPTFTYVERWSPYRLNFSNFSFADTGVRVDTVRGFQRNYDYNFNMALTTQVYGIFQFKKGPISAIRHKIIPTVSFAYRPDFGSSFFDFYQNRVVDERGTRQRLNAFQGTLYGAPAFGEQRNMRVDLQNNLEMKLRPKSDTGETARKIMLLDNFGLNGLYNFAADSGKLSTIQMVARTSIFGKIQINFSGVLNPYAVFLDSIFTTNVGERRVAQTRSQSLYAWQSGQGIGQVTNYNLAVSTSLNPDFFNGKSSQRQNDRERGSGPNDDPERAFIQANPNLYVDFTIPWSLNLSYNFIYQRDGFNEKRTTQTLNFGGDIRLTEKWKIGTTSGFDFVAQNLSFTSIDVYRDLHCWEMRFNWIPLGPRQSFQFDINVKSSLLQDLKLSKRNNWYDR